jgi:hypothetical protein
MLKDYILQQLALITDHYEDNTIEENADGSITLIATVFFDRTYVTVKKPDGVAGWTKKVDHQNGYSVSFQIVPISDTQINIEVYTQGITANAMLYAKNKDGDKVWMFGNYNNVIESFNYADYPYIQFTNSHNRSNPFTGFIAYYIGLIKKCLNDEFHDYEDDSSYDSEPEYKDTALEGDLILTINDKTYNTLKRLGKAIKLSDGTLLPITKDMFGKKVVRKDSKPEVLFPLNEDDFI